MPESATYTPDNTVESLDAALASVQETWRPDDDERAQLVRVMDRIEKDLVPSQQNFWQEWDDAKRIYEAYIPSDPTNTREKFKIPWSHTIIETAVAEEVDAFPDIVIDTQEGDDKQKLPILNAAKKYALQRAGWEKVKMEALRLRRIYGWCAVRVYYSRETRVIKQRKPVMKDGGMMMAYEEVIDYPYDDIRFEVIDNPKRFLVDDAARDLDDTSGRGADDCALLTDMSWSAFAEMVQHDKRFKNIKFVKPGCEYTINDKMEIVPPEQNTPDSTKRVRMVEYWNRRTDEYVVIVNGIIIRSVPLVDDHKDLPFAVIHLHRRPHTFYSKGIPKLIESLEACYNAIMQAEVRATKLAFPILRMDEDGTVDPKSVSPYPGVVIEGAKDSVELMQLGSVPGEVYKLKDKLESLLIWVTGINYQQLFSTEGSDRVGIEALKKEGMLARVNANLRENEANFLIRLGGLLMQDIMQYYTTPKVRRLMSSDDLGALAKETIRWDDIVMPRLVTDPKTNMPRGVWELRKIPVEGMQVKEIANNEKGLFTLRSTSSGGASYILARPEYIRTLSKLDVRAARPSAMGSSKEAKKLMLMEISNHALLVNQAQTAAQQPPIWNMTELEKQIAEINEMNVKKVIEGEEGSEESIGEKFRKMSTPITELLKNKQEAGQMPPAPLPAQPNVQQAQSMAAQPI